MPDSREAAIAAATEAAVADWVRTQRLTEAAPVERRMLREDVTRALDAAHAAGLIHYTDACDAETAEWEKRWTDAEYAWRERVGVLEAIVRDLAASEHVTSPWTAEKRCRFHCGAYEGRSEEQVEQRPVAFLESHDPTCLWRRSREWVEQQATNT